MYRLCFNPRPRTGGDAFRILSVVSDSQFQSTPPHGGRRCIAFTAEHWSSFNPRPRTGGDSPYQTGSADGRCFNPRPRTGGDASGSAKVRGVLVSIHAPARGATLDSHGQFQLALVSIHAPARGATSTKTVFPWGSISFNPRPRTGGDIQGLQIEDRREVSIHAPARGATTLIFMTLFRQMFQSTPPHGGRQLALTYRY